MRQKKVRKASPEVVEAPLPKPPTVEGLPNPASVVSEQTLVSPTGRTYTILKTAEVDASDKRTGKRKKRKGKAPKRP